MIRATLEVKECEEGNKFLLMEAGKKEWDDSLNGVGTAISVNTGKVLACEMFVTSFVRIVFSIPLKETKPSEYEVVWKVNHKGKCQLNDAGSASSMECYWLSRYFLDQLKGIDCIILDIILTIIALWYF